MASRLASFSEQPVSVISSFVIQLRTPLPMRDCMRRLQVSMRFVRTPATMSAPLCSSFAIIAGMSAGSFCRSASSETTSRPRAACHAASSAAVWPAFFSNGNTRSIG